MFRRLDGARTVRWAPYEGQGLEHLVIEPGSNGIDVRAVVIGDRGGIPYGARYRIHLDAGWRVTEFGISTADGRGLALVSPEAGRWIDAAGEALPLFDGCVDIDLAASPFTNTLPIRRLNISEAQGTVELDMLYVPFETLAPTRDGQRYTCLEREKRYRYEAADRSFSAEITVDADGLVTDYPPLFRRS